MKIKAARFRLPASVQGYQIYEAVPGLNQSWLDFKRTTNNESRYGHRKRLTIANNNKVTHEVTN